MHALAFVEKRNLSFMHLIHTSPRNHTTDNWITKWPHFQSKTAETKTKKIENQIKNSSQSHNNLLTGIASTAAPFYTGEGKKWVIVLRRMRYCDTIYKFSGSDEFLSGFFVVCFLGKGSKRNKKKWYFVLVGDLYTNIFVSAHTVRTIQLPLKTNNVNETISAKDIKIDP